MADNDKTKSKLGSALTTVGQPGAKKGSLAAALGGTAVAGPRATHQVQHVDKATQTTLAAVRKTGGAAGHMAYIIDATASRSDMWEQAQRIQRDMFREAGKSGALTVRLIHYGGDSINDRGWFTSAEALSGAMGGVRCHSGRTQICESIDTIVNRSEKLPRNIVLIGDSYEEGLESLEMAASQLAVRGIKVFAFLDVMDGRDAGAEHAFRMLADKTGGSFQIFGQGMNLQALCEAVAAYTTGGDEALKKLAQTSKEAKAISGQVLRLGYNGPKP